MKKQKHVRLSPHIVPTKYELSLTPDLEAFVFEGSETVHLTLKKSVKNITLHAAEIDIESAHIDAGALAMAATKISYNEAAETATITFNQSVPKGTAALTLRFRGILNDKMRGFYRSSYEHEGKLRHLATTQFESTDARRAFPCFDEPAVKAIFEVALTVPSASTAISNTLPVDIVEHASGYKTVSFAPTPPMSTYLAAFIVGDFEYIEKKSADGVLVRVFTTPGKKEQSRFALECAAKTISFFNEYFDIPYPLPVVDLIAIPDFAAGAMENWGAITYRESALLVDPEHSSTMNKQWVALVIAHELAHQWFGNLVTMEWWTHLWLNEGFASYIEYLAVDHMFPSWNIWTQFLHADMRRALTMDGLKHTHSIEVEVHHPSEIAAVFDAVSYSKGASIIRMLAEYLGERDFRDGLRHYLKKHRYGNTETKDLWQALQKVSGKPVAALMAAWTGVAGYPMLTISESASHLTLEQSRFFASPLSAKENRTKALWRIPVQMMTNKGKVRDTVVLRTKKTRVKKPIGAWVKFNAGESGFYRTVYPERMRSALAAAAREKKLDAIDRLGLVRDVCAIAETGALTTADALRFAFEYEHETEYVIWAELASSMAVVHALFAGESFHTALEQRLVQLFQTIGTALGWDHEPKSHMESLLKVLALASLGKYGHKETIARARKFFESARKGTNRIPADLRGVVYNTVARHGGAKEHESLIEMYKRAALHEEKNRIGGALTVFCHVALLEKTLRFSLSPDVRPQDSARLIGGVAASANGSDVAWRFIQKHWPLLTERYSGGRELQHILESLSLSVSLARARELTRFLKAHPTPGTERTVDQVVEQIRSNAARVARDRKSLAAYFKA